MLDPAGIYSFSVWALYAAVVVVALVKRRPKRSARVAIGFTVLLVGQLCLFLVRRFVLPGPAFGPGDEPNTYLLRFVLFDLAQLLILGVALALVVAAVLAGRSNQAPPVGQPPQPVWTGPPRPPGPGIPYQGPPQPPPVPPASGGGP